MRCWASMAFSCRRVIFETTGPWTGFCGYVKRYCAQYSYFSTNICNHIAGITEPELKHVDKRPTSNETNTNQAITAMTHNPAAAVIAGRDNALLRTRPIPMA